jgi:transcriptional regulator with XRE-family HTH domain
MTQEQLAAASGVHRVTIARIERGYGNTCTLDTISRLAAALGVTIEELMDRETG